MAKKQTSKKGKSKPNGYSKKSNHMSEQQKRFADEYLENGNAMQAALAAGYSEKYAKAQSYRLLDSVGIKAYISERVAAMDEKRIAKADEALAFLTSVMRGEVMDQLGLETPVAERSKAALALAKRLGSLKDKHELELQEIAKDKLRAETERIRLEMQLAKERLELEKQRLELDRERAKLGDDDDEETGVLAMPSVDVETYEREKAEELARLTAELGEGDAQ